MNWKSVADELPELGKMVDIAILDMSVSVGCLYKDKNGYKWDDVLDDDLQELGWYLKFEAVSHWKERPIHPLAQTEPPKEEKRLSLRKIVGGGGRVPRVA